MDTERLLPKDMRLDSYVEYCVDELNREIDDVRLKNAAKDILDHEVEFNSMENLRSFASLARSVNERVVLQNDELAYESMYRAVVFAYQISDMVQGNAVSFDATPYLWVLTNRQDGYEDLIRDTHLYLADNPSLDVFMKCYIDELDGGRGYPHLVEITAALVFMLTERALAEEFLAEEMQHCSVQEFDI